MFPVPGTSERARLWKILLTSNGVKAELVLDMLAEVPLTGGLIRNAVLNACSEKTSLRETFQISSALLLDLEFREISTMPSQSRRRQSGSG